jgi:hypothetical protein
VSVVPLPLVHYTDLHCYDLIFATQVLPPNTSAREDDDLTLLMVTLTHMLLAIYQTAKVSSFIEGLQ